MIPSVVANPGRQVARPTAGAGAALLTDAAAICGTAALALRPPATGPAAAVSLMVGLAAVLLPLPATSVARRPAAAPAAALALGLVAVIAARGLAARGTADVPGRIRAAPPVVVAVTAASLAEEALFHRVLYARLLPFGVPAALAGSAGAFAAVHVPVWGPAGVAMNLAAGLLFGWQRWTAGGWLVPAATHLTANLLLLDWREIGPRVRALW